MGGIVLTKKGREFCEKMVLEAYCNPDTREEVEEMAKCLGLDLEKIKDSFVKGALDVEKAAAVMILCEANGCKCTICGGAFAPCEDICSVGQHQIGQHYYHSPR